MPDPPKPLPDPPPKYIAGVSRTCAQAFDEWLRRFISDPSCFQEELQAAGEFVAEGGPDGKATTYGRYCAAYLRKLMGGG